MSRKLKAEIPEEEIQPVVEIDRDASIKRLVNLITDEQADAILAQYNPNIVRRIFGDGELMRTADCFIHSSLNISAAARNIYMHRNTMMYRLDKIERLIGLDIRTYDDAIAFDILHKLYIRKLRRAE